MEYTIVKGTGKCPKLPWMIEFHSTADGKIFNDQLKAAFAPNYLEHLSSLHDESKLRRKRLTQFPVVIPPNASLENYDALLKAGMTVAVFRFDYFTSEELFYAVENMQHVNEEFGKKIGRIYPLAIALEISEPQILTGTLEKPNQQIELEQGQTTKVLADPRFKNRVSKDYIYVDYDDIAKVVKPGDSLILGDDVHMSAIEIARDIVECIVERAGLLANNLSVKLPNTPLILPPSESHVKLEEITKKIQVDIIFVGPTHIDMAKETLPVSTLFFVKIEHISVVRDFNTIIKKVDGVLIDGEKLMASSKENVVLVQKTVIANCNKLGKPVISFVNCASLTKAQADDIGNTIIDGVDALLLPPDPDLIESICLLCKAAEGAIYQKQIFEDLCSLLPRPIEPITSVCISAVQASFNTNAAAIILLTTSGRSAKLVSMYRPRCPIIALTRLGRTAKQLMVHRGVIPIFYVQSSGDSFAENVEKKVQMGMTFGKIQGYIKMGDAVVIMFGIKNHVGFRNCVEVVFASEFDTIPDVPDT